MTDAALPFLARRPGPTVRTRVREFVEGEERVHEDRLATEEPLEIRLAWPGRAAERAWVTMRTPGHDFELAAGWALHEGYGAPAGVAYCTEVTLASVEQFNVVTLTLSAAPATTPPRHHSLATGSSACGVCGKDSIDAVLDLPAGQPWSGPLPSPDVVRRLPGLLRPAQTVFSRTGGLHGAGLFTADGDLLVVREDIGRHNAVDKVSGARVLSGSDVAAACLVVSGRAGFELVQKAVAAGHGALVAVGAPSSLAVDLARSSGLALYGFVRDHRCVRYA